MDPHLGLVGPDFPVPFLSFTIKTSVFSRSGLPLRRHPSSTVTSRSVVTSFRLRSEKGRTGGERTITKDNRFRSLPTGLSPESPMWMNWSEDPCLVPSFRLLPTAPVPRQPLRCRVSTSLPRHPRLPLGPPVSVSHGRASGTPDTRSPFINYGIGP